MNERFAGPQSLSLIERVAGINRFIETTGRLTAQQLSWLPMIEKFCEPQRFTYWDETINRTIYDNVTALADVCQSMSQSGERLLVPHPTTLSPVTVAGFGYSTQLRTYQVCIATPTPHKIPLESALVIG